MGSGGAALLGSEGPGGAVEAGLLSALLCWLPCPSAGTAWGGEVVPTGGLQAGESPPAVQDHISLAIQHAMRRVSGPPPSWGLLL